MTDFWKTWDGPGKKPNPRPAPKCKTHGTTKVRQHGRAPYRCPDCEREAYWAERGGDA
jgi:hypothetical protein